MSTTAQNPTYDLDLVRSLIDTTKRHTDVLLLVTEVIDFMIENHETQDRNDSGYQALVNRLRYDLGLNTAGPGPEYFMFGIALVRLEHAYRRTLDALGHYLAQAQINGDPNAARTYRNTLAALTAAKRRVILLLAETN